MIWFGWEKITLDREDVVTRKKKWSEDCIAFSEIRKRN